MSIPATQQLTNSLPNRIQPTPPKPSIEFQSDPLVDDDAPKPPGMGKPDPTFDDELAARETKEQFEVMRGDMPCLDSSVQCLQSLQDLAIKNSGQLKQLATAITGAEDAMKAAAAPNTWKDIQVFKPLILGATGGVVGGLVGVVDNLAANGSDAKKDLIQNADLQTRVAQLQRAKVEAEEVTRNRVVAEVIRFEELYTSAQTQTQVAQREAARLRVIEVAYRLGGSVSTTEYVGLVNVIDQKKLTVANVRSSMRAQAERIKRLVLGGE